MDTALKIFVAVNNRLASELAKGALSFLGFSDVRFARDASIAREELLKYGGEILIIDYANLKGDGANLLDTLKNREELAQIKIILVIIEELDVSALKQLYKEGVNSVIKFPFQISDLQKALSDTVRSVRAETFAKIRQLDFFCFLTDDEMLRLLKMTKCRKYEKDEIIFDEGRPGDRFYVVIEGKVSILKVLGDDKEELLARLEKGACFGEMAILQNTTRSARARATDTALLFELDSKLMDGYDDIITLKLFKKLTYVLSDRLRTADKKIKELAQTS